MARIKRILSYVLVFAVLVFSLPSGSFKPYAAGSDFSVPAGTFEDIKSIASAFKYQTADGYAPIFSGGAVTLKRANDKTSLNNSAGAITHFTTLPAGDYVWQFELTMTAADAVDGKYKTACDFGVYKTSGDKFFYYGSKGIPVSARYIDLNNIDEDIEKNNQRAYCNQIRDFGTPYFHYTGSNVDDVNKHYYVLVDFTLNEETKIALSITTASTGYSATIDNFHLFSANDEKTLNSLEYLFAVNNNCNYSIDTREKYVGENDYGKYQSLKYTKTSDTEDSFLYPQPIYSDRNNFYRLTKGNLYKIKFKYKCTVLFKNSLTMKNYPITVYPTCGYKKDSVNTVYSNESITLRFLLNGFDKVNSFDNKAMFVISATSSEWKDAEIDFWAYNANGQKDLDLEISELLSLSVSGKGTVNFDEIEVINLGNPLETETTVSDGKYVADGNYVFAPYGALIQNGKACNKNADGSFTVSNGSLTKKLYYKSDTGLSVYKVETVERGDETLFFNKQPGMIFSIYVEDYSPSNEYGALVIRNASEATLQKIDNNVKIDMVKTFFNNNCNGWKEYSVYGTAVSFSVIENEQSTKSGNDFCQFDVKVYGNLDKNTEKDGVPYKDMKVSVSAYKISQNNYSFSENFKSAAYSGNIFSEISYNEVPSVTNHTGTGGILPLFWQYGDDENGWYTYTPEQLNACVQQLKYLNVSIVRCFAFQPGYAWNAETNTWNWNTKYMRAFYEYAKTMYENGIEIIINTTAGVASGSQCGEPLPTGLGTTDAEVYPKFVEAFIKNVVNGEGLPNEYSDYAEYLSGIQYFMYATEPNNGDDTENENYDPATSNRLNNYKRVIQETHKYLTGVGLRNRVKLIGPNTVDISKDARTVKWAVENIDEYIDIYAAHSAYSRVDDMKSNQYHHWQDFNRICQSILLSKGINKPFWHDEYNIFMINAYGGYDSSLDNALRGTQLATAQISMMQNGASSSLLWTLFDFKWTNSYRSTTAGFNRGFFKFGLAPSVLEFAAPEDAYVYAPYYAYSALGTAIKSGDTVYSGISTEDGIYTALLKHKNGKYSIVAVNNSSEAVAMKINLPDDANGYYTHILYDPFGNPETGYNTENYSEVSAVDIISSAIGAYQVAIFNLN